MKTLNIIGSGRVGRACGRLWARAHVFEVQDVLTRTRASAGEGVKFIGAGHAVGHLDEMRGDAEKARRDFGWQPIIPLETSLAEVLEEWRALGRAPSPR